MSTSTPTSPSTANGPGGTRHQHCRILNCALCGDYTIIHFMSADAKGKHFRMAIRFESLRVAITSLIHSVSRVVGTLGFIHPSLLQQAQDQAQHCVQQGVKSKRSSFNSPLPQRDSVSFIQDKIIESRHHLQDVRGGDPGQDHRVVLRVGGALSGAEP